MSDNTRKAFNDGLNQGIEANVVAIYELQEEVRSLRARQRMVTKQCFYVAIWKSAKPLWWYHSPCSFSYIGTPRDLAQGKQ